MQGGRASVGIGAMQNAENNSKNLGNLGGGRETLFGQGLHAGMISPRVGRRKRQERPSDLLTAEQRTEFLHLYARFVCSDRLDSGEPLTEDELAKVKEQTMEMKDVERMCKALGYGHSAKNPIKPREMREMMAEVDPDHTGSIGYTQFLDLMASHLNEDEEVEQLVSAFGVLAGTTTSQTTGEKRGDTKVKTMSKGGEREGVWISPSNLKYYLTNFGERLTDEEVDELFAEADIGVEGDLDVGLFVRSVLRK